MSGSDVVLQCVKCGQHFAALEAYLRNIYPGLCGNCGGAFKVNYIPLPKSK